jgi:hypothetical protein
MLPHLKASMIDAIVLAGAGPRTLSITAEHGRPCPRGGAPPRDDGRGDSSRSRKCPLPECSDVTDASTNALQRGSILNVHVEVSVMLTAAADFQPMIAHPEAVPSRDYDDRVRTRP